ncbi:hypothetical protein CcI49_28095 [Frankia sp. CcI49]|uniref:NYN domain-containing protein n=1 Tax=Frankia sp. CcI49 TaxID=1745382 RepID=UPI0009788C46|nr:NYN domain-containing protein [Frankia sp. CcI49]ONH55402.1 hypothetical protein CcI49_28095 [Frankia sp. CcI49]
MPNGGGIVEIGTNLGGVATAAGNHRHADNIPQWAVEPLLLESAQYGKVRIRRAFGDWSGSLRSWKKALQELSIRPVQVFAAVKGKNAADLALTIDAMDLLHPGSVDAICIASSDSDFTRRAERIRESGLTVHGFGEETKTNPGLPAACDTSVFVETLMADTPPTRAAKSDQATPPPPPPGASDVTARALPSAETARRRSSQPCRQRRRRGPWPGLLLGRRPLSCVRTSRSSVGSAMR